MNDSYAEYVPAYKALADETRLKIVMMLTKGELCACSILENFNITQPTLSYHMKILTESGLVQGRRDGAWMRYSLNLEKVAIARKLLDDIGDSTGNQTICYDEKCEE